MSAWGGAYGGVTGQRLDNMGRRGLSHRLDLGYGVRRRLSGADPALTVLTPDVWQAPFDHLIANAYDSSLTMSFAASDEVGMVISQGFQDTTARPT